MEGESDDGSGGDSKPHKSLSEDMDIMGNTECKFKVNSFKMVFVVNNESYLYKRTALKRAREVSTFEPILNLNRLIRYK